MAKFTDAKGREWTIEIPNFRAIKDLREHGLDINAAAQTFGGMAELFEDAERLVQGAWVLLKTTPDISFDTWTEAIDRDALERLKLAFGEAVLDFFHHRRAGNAKPLLMSLLDPSIPTGSNGSAGNSPGSSASTPTA